MGVISPLDISLGRVPLLVMKLLILNGPNLNMVGIRESNIYGEESFEDINLQIKNFAEKYYPLISESGLIFSLSYNII